MKNPVANIVVWMSLLGPSLANAQTESKTPTTLETLSPKQFCARVTNSLNTFAVQNGVERRQALRFAAKAANEIAYRLKTKTLDPYLDVSSLQIAKEPQDGGQWLNTNDLLVTALGHAPERVLMVDQVNDLRFTSHVMPKSQLLVLASDAADINSERAKLVAETSKSLGLKIHVIWLNSSRTPTAVKGAQVLASIAASTGGIFMNFSNQKTCGTM